MMTFRNIAPAVAFVLTIGGVAVAQETPERIDALAREARSAGEHADVAKRYRLHAEAQESRAAELEARAARMASSARTVSSKWPAMAPRTLADTRQHAVEARKAALESRQLADRHQALAVEALAAQ